jgi:hypothetical protein
LECYNRFIFDTDAELAQELAQETLADASRVVEPVGYLATGQPIYPRSATVKAMDDEMRDLGIMRPKPIVMQERQELASEEISHSRSASAPGFSKTSPLSKQEERSASPPDLSPPTERPEALRLRAFGVEINPNVVMYRRKVLERRCIPVADQPRKVVRWFVKNAHIRDEMAWLLFQLSESNKDFDFREWLLQQAKEKRKPPFLVWAFFWATMDSFARASKWADTTAMYEDSQRYYRRWLGLALKRVPRETNISPEEVRHRLEHWNCQALSDDVLAKLRALLEELPLVKSVGAWQLVVTHQLQHLKKAFASEHSTQLETAFLVYELSSRLSYGDAAIMLDDWMRTKLDGHDSLCALLWACIADRSHADRLIADVISEDPQRIHLSYYERWLELDPNFQPHASILVSVVAARLARWGVAQPDRTVLASLEGLPLAQLETRFVSFDHRKFEIAFAVYSWFFGATSTCADALFASWLLYHSEGQRTTELNALLWATVASQDLALRLEKLAPCYYCGCFKQLCADK